MLRIAEHFYSIQGEGYSVGVPAYFIRLQGCNLMCGGHNAALVKEGKATWWCDSEVIWKRGTDTSYEQLEQSFIDQGILERVLNGNIHLIWTGGEPTMPKHQKAIMGFIDYIEEKHFNDDNPFLSKTFNEIETNGTIVTSDDFYEYIDQINCSAKLANSGMSESMRINPEAINQIVEHRNSTFKFVISTEDDIKEIQETYIKPFNIPEDTVIIMPGVDNRVDLSERTAFLFEMTKKYGYRGVTRQHILAWDKVTGV
jgi:organic radical activating enzyme